MDQAELKRFLQTVRQPRFLDYLDPTGETPEQALERRLRWAAMSRNDPAHADEANFLIRNQDDLRVLVAEEGAEEEEDEEWVETAEAGNEYGWGVWMLRGDKGPGSAGPSRLPGDESAEPAAAKAAAMGWHGDPEPLSPLYDEDEVPTNITRIEDLTPSPPEERVADSADTDPSAPSRQFAPARPAPRPSHVPRMPTPALPGRADPSYVRAGQADDQHSAVFESDLDDSSFDSYVSSTSPSVGRLAAQLKRDKEQDEDILTDLRSSAREAGRKGGRRSRPAAGRRRRSLLLPLLLVACLMAMVGGGAGFAWYQGYLDPLLGTGTTVATVEEPVEEPEEVEEPVADLVEEPVEDPVDDTDAAEATPEDGTAEPVADPKSEPVVKADPPKRDPPKRDPPKRDPPKDPVVKADPPKTDPPADPPKSDPPKEDGSASTDPVEDGSADAEGTGTDAGTTDPPVEEDPGKIEVVGGNSSSQASIPDMKGMWIGKFGDRSCYFNVTGQDGETITGEAQVKFDSGWSKVPLQGRYNVARGSILLRGTDGRGAEFRGNVSGKSITGTAMLYAGGQKSPWTAAK